MRCTHALVGIVTVAVVLFFVDLLVYVRFERSLVSMDDFYQRLAMTVLSRRRAASDVVCYTAVMRLLRRNATRSRFLVELQPPQPASVLPLECQAALRPAPASRQVSNATVRCFANRSFTGGQMDEVRRSLRVVKELFDQHRIPLLLYAGTLVGSWRNHGVIPYDDDFDFRFPRNEKPRVKRLLEELSRRDPSFRFRDTDRQVQHYQMDIGCRPAGKAKKLACLTFIDFFYYWQELGRVKVLEPPRSYPRSVYFPPVKRPFEGLLYDSVNDYEAYYRHDYGKYKLDECVSINHSGGFRKGCKASVPCAQLSAFLPFVVRFKSAHNIVEVMTDRGLIRSVFHLPRRNK